MINERVYIYPSDRRAYLDIFAQDDARIAPRDAILIFPGGGYSMTCSDREGESIALAYLSRGINAFVLTYNTDKDSVFPSQLLDASTAFKYIKNNAEKYHIDPERIFVIGFSAGGHLAGSLTVHHKNMEKVLSLPENFLKPRGSILSYAVTTAYEPWAHKASFESLLKKPYAEITEQEKRFHSIEKNVGKDAPPAFIWHTVGDKSVPVQNALMLGMAYGTAGAPFEMHIYPQGPHGLSLAIEATSVGAKELIIPEVSEWLDRTVAWMEKQ